MAIAAPAPASVPLVGATRLRLDLRRPYLDEKPVRRAVAALRVPLACGGSWVAERSRDAGLY